MDREDREFDLIAASIVVGLLILGALIAGVSLVLKLRTK
jgi:hypothetical protein